MKIQEVNSLDEFMKLGGRDWHPIHKWVYRGVPDADFGLRPAIGRNPIMREGKVDTWRIMDNEEHLLNEFKRHAPVYTEKSPVGDLDWLCLARHYGLATRLLDWTSNPLVALFFAANPEQPTNFAVYRYWFNSWLGDRHTMDMKTIQRQKESLIFYPRLTTERFVRQSSAFLLCHEPWRDFDFEDAPENLTKIVFPAETRNQVRYQLRIFGVTPSFVRPDLDGLCEELNDRILHPKKFWIPLPPLEGPNPLLEAMERAKKENGIKAARRTTRGRKRRTNE